VSACYCLCYLSGAKDLHSFMHCMIGGNFTDKSCNNDEQVSIELDFQFVGAENSDMLF
jgi:hypothetical protein